MTCDLTDKVTFYTININYFHDIRVYKNGLKKTTIYVKKIPYLLAPSMHNVFQKLQIKMICIHF